MNLSNITQKLGLVNLTPELNLSAVHDMTQGYVSDLLSDVLGNAPAGGLLITVQVHLNVVAVSVHADLAAVIFALGRIPDETTRERAVKENIVLLSSHEPAFDIAGKLYALGMRGDDSCD